jgi:integrase
MSFDFYSYVSNSSLHIDVKKELKSFFEKRLHLPTRNRRRKHVVSDATMLARVYGVVSALETLGCLGFAIQSLTNLKAKHVQALHLAWTEGPEKLSTGRIANLNAHLNQLITHFGKVDLVQGPAQLIPGFRRSQIAIHDRSWIGSEVDISSVLASLCAMGYDGIRVAAMLEYSLAFGLRARESWLFEPEIALRDGLQRALVQVTRGTKGGRERTLSLHDPLQIEVLFRTLYLENGKTGTLIPLKYQLSQWNNRYYYLLRKARVMRSQIDGHGVTTHGLRHQYLHEIYRRITGVEPPIRGGHEIDYQTYRSAMSSVVSAAGHSDIGKAGAYLSTRLAVRRQVQLLRAELDASDTLARNPLKRD